MTHSRRSRRRAAAFAALILVPAGSALLAQETNTIVGPPQIKDFQLPGQRTTPPQPAPTTPAPTPAPAPRTAPPESTTAGPVRRTPTPRPAPARAPAPRIETPAPAPAEALPPPAQVIPAPVQIAPAPAPTPAPAPVEGPPPAESGGSLLWLWIALGAVVAGLAAFAFLRRRRRAEEELRLSHGDALASSLVVVERPERRPEPQPEPESAPAEAPRAWLELDIIPERAAATERETSVNYELVLRNAGGAEAGNIRIDGRMFNANEERAISDFFAGPIHARSGSPHVTIQPGAELRLQTITSMPKEEVRAIEVQGRSIFVPMIAINVAYDWADGGAGRSSKSWLVGREADTPQAKMGPFRLDLGPRIYRQVGRRNGKLVMV